MVYFYGENSLDESVTEKTKKEIVMTDKISNWKKILKAHPKAGTTYPKVVQKVIELVRKMLDEQAKDKSDTEEFTIYWGISWTNTLSALTEQDLENLKAVYTNPKVYPLPKVVFNFVGKFVQ